MRERVVHWLVGLSFIYLMLTGLALFTPYLYWLAYVFGSGPTIRKWHPIIGVVYFVVLMWMYLLWWRDMKLDAEDRAWLKNVGTYIRNEEDKKPLAEAGRFNAGQKQFFWVMVIFSVLLLLSGIPLWFPESFGESLRLVSILVHEISALVTIGGIIVHIYMGTAVVRGSIRAITTGTVTPTWAKSHHPRWYREITGRR
jgi:formate dehydrogenase subunit gamma